MHEVQYFGSVGGLLVQILVINKILVLFAKRDRDLSKTYITITLVDFAHWEQTLDLGVWSGHKIFRKDYVAMWLGSQPKTNSLCLNILYNALIKNFVSSKLSCVVGAQ